ncbi:hypothetical protein ASN18_3197 [Candidatus Magnetominusculus xianensis]|uniref:Secreted protein n=1 Tax=Candidatus Magnetominusculus xianensis TaxID=1748249 RepID=A0ABR5SCR2_9BACT|nr:hypothetical protein ASN18_3197 [Candidatus Magnetominusculus xianensis]
MELKSVRTSATLSTVAGMTVANAVSVVRGGWKRWD